MSSTVEALARVRQLAASGRAQEIRERAGVSLGEVAADVGVTPTAIWRWEGGGENRDRNGRRPRGSEALRYLRVLDRLAAQFHQQEEVAHG